MLKIINPGNTNLVKIFSAFLCILIFTSIVAAASDGYITLKIKNYFDNKKSVKVYVDGEYNGKYSVSAGKKKTFLEIVKVSGNKNHKVKIKWEDEDDDWQSDTETEYVKAGTDQLFYFQIGCSSVTCKKDSDCNDGNSHTEDTCEYAGSCKAYCSNQKIPYCGDGSCNNGETCSSCSNDCGKCAPYCGDKICNNGETCSTCSMDCGKCQPTEYCGDGQCNNGETSSSCQGDCPVFPWCGDKICNNGETCSSCEQDCGACFWCGDGSCNNGETCSSCSSDCGKCADPTPDPTPNEFCGDKICNNGETCSSCSSDCGKCQPNPDNQFVYDLSKTKESNQIGSMICSENDGEYKCISSLKSIKPVIYGDNLLLAGSELSNLDDWDVYPKLSKKEYQKLGINKHGPEMGDIRIPKNEFNIPEGTKKMKHVNLASTVYKNNKPLYNIHVFKYGEKFYAIDGENLIKISKPFLKDIFEGFGYRALSMSNSAFKKIIKAGEEGIAKLERKGAILSLKMLMKSPRTAAILVNFVVPDPTDAIIIVLSLTKCGNQNCFDEFVGATGSFYEWLTYPKVPCFPEGTIDIPEEWICEPGQIYQKGIVTMTINGKQYTYIYK